jgi:hypothetical protein
MDMGLDGCGRGLVGEKSILHPAGFSVASCKDRGLAVRRDLRAAGSFIGSLLRQTYAISMP